jgi:small subunit ribosomal protein S17
MTETATQVERGQRKVREGIVVSNKMDKTIVVAVERRVPHALYGKYIRRTRKFMAHDPENACQIGDKVRIMETRPLSRQKKWRLVEILGRQK